MTRSATCQPPEHRTKYAYDAAGNLNSRTNNALVQTFSVNELNELTTAERSGTLTVAGTSTGPATEVTVNGQLAELYGDYTFAKPGLTLADGTNTFTAIAHDSYGRTDTNTISTFLPSTSNFTYDSNGNLTSDGRRCFAYDDENQLVSVWITNVWRSDFAYDGKMRRRIRYESTWTGSAWATNTIVRYVYDGNLVIQERDANNLPLVSYTRGKDLSGTLEGAGGIGGLLARSEMSNLQSPHAYYHPDGNGNVTCLINTNQVIVAYYLYDPYGNILSQSGPLAEANTYRFSSKELHVASGLVYYLYRCYEPTLQRWMNRDPVGELGGANLFQFVASDPVVGLDLWGLKKPNWPPITVPPGGPRPPGPGLRNWMGLLASAAATLIDTDCQGKCSRSSCESCCKDVAATLSALNAAASVAACVGSGAWFCAAAGAVAILAQQDIIKNMDSCMLQCQSKSP
ncbi:MAG TPA: RHS repeat-associated core domain-containing protein [Verrucomicrobiota bacterium]|jgi:RHS repeat-associated protein|nr:RHS repeat-associated core domain-containing protein [Verrucomicrobiota bacterium]HQL79136.1 RHS repeat-associated core domain-containing protein [Verrucomicrobiota bacterium]